MSTSTAVKKLTMVTAGAVLIALQIGGAAQAVVLTFDDNTSNIESISNGYGGLDWNNFSYADSSWTPAYESSGYINGTVSGNYVAFNRYGESATLTSSSGFDFSSVYLTAAWNNGLSITVEGLNDGTPLYSKTVVVDTASSALVDFNYQGIDELKFTSFGGVNAGFEDDRGRDGEQFVLDNLAFNPLPTVPSTGGGGTPIVDVPGAGGGIAPIVDVPGAGGGIAPIVDVPGAGGGIAPIVDIPGAGGSGTPIVDIPGAGGGGTPIVDIPGAGGDGTPIVDIPGAGGDGTPIVDIPGAGGDGTPIVGGDPDPGTPTPIPYEPSSGLGLLTLGAFGAGAVLKRKLQQKAKTKNFI